MESDKNTAVGIAYARHEIQIMQRLTMISRTYIVADENGIHARPAGVIVQAAKKFASSVTLSVKTETGEVKKADARKLFAVMGLGAVRGTVLTITAEGEDEETAAAELEDAMKKAGL